MPAGPAHATLVGTPCDSSPSIRVSSPLTSGSFGLYNPVGQIARNVCEYAASGRVGCAGRYGTAVFSSLPVVVSSLTDRSTDSRMAAV